MTKYLVRKTHHTTGETFTDVIKIRDNESYQVVEAESKGEALERVENRYALYNYDEQICTGTLDDVRYMMRLLGKCWKNENLEFELEIRKDSE